MIGYIVVEPDQRVERVPEFLLEQEEILWPVSENLLREQAPTEPVHYIDLTQFYQRHRMTGTDIEVFVRTQRDPNGLPEDINADICKRAERVRGGASAEQQ